MGVSRMQPWDAGVPSLLNESHCSEDTLRLEYRIEWNQMLPVMRLP